MEIIGEPVNRDEYKIRLHSTKSIKNLQHHIEMVGRRHITMEQTGIPHEEKEVSRIDILAPGLTKAELEIYGGVETFHSGLIGNGLERIVSIYVEQIRGSDVNEMVYIRRNLRGSLKTISSASHDIYSKAISRAISKRIGILIDIMQRIENTLETQVSYDYDFLPEFAALCAEPVKSDQQGAYNAMLKHIAYHTVKAAKKGEPEELGKMDEILHETNFDLRERKLGLSDKMDEIGYALSFLYFGLTNLKNERAHGEGRPSYIH